MSLDILGTCPNCGAPVLESHGYYHDRASGLYWHESCAIKDEDDPRVKDVGIE